MRITITITGAHGVGKTTLLNALTPILELMGFRRRGAAHFRRLNRHLVSEVGDD